jgi:hypothetical protein
MRRAATLCRIQSRWAPCFLVACLAGCGDPLYLGSDLIWSARLESGDLAEWSSDAQRFADHPADADNVRVSDARARGGHYALSITRPPSDHEGGPAIGHAAALPKEAYYAAWLYLPDDYPVNTYWAVLELRSLGTAASPDTFPDDGIDIRLRKLPGGQFMLYVFSHDRAFLQPPLVDPPALVAVGQWFHLETFFRLAPDATGALQVWLNGRLVYDLPSRATGSGRRPWFGVSSVSADDGTTSLNLFVDDVTISYSRATPDELLDRP